MGECRCDLLKNPSIIFQNHLNSPLLITFSRKSFSAFLLFLAKAYAAHIAAKKTTLAINQVRPLCAIFLRSPIIFVVL
jgi:hypothetical protein